MLTSIIDLLMLAIHRKEELVQPEIFIQPAREMILTPGQYRNLYENDPSNIQSVSIIPPALGSSNYGLLKVHLHRPVNIASTKSDDWKHSHVQVSIENNLIPV